LAQDTGSQGTGASPARAGSPAGSVGGGSRALRLPGWILLGLILAALGVLVHLLAERIGRRGFDRVDTARSALAAEGQWVDARWREELSARVAAHPPFVAGDAESRRRLVESAAALSFVAAVGEPRVLWPDGLELPVRLRQPVACVRVGRRYQPVAADGVLLSGLWPAPPKVGAGWLPLLSTRPGVFDDALPGDRLGSQGELAALRMALVLRTRLAPEELEVLGRAVIDANRAHLASPDEPGLCILLEDRRLVRFGRAPDTDEPGELPLAQKLASLAQGLRDLRTRRPELDWDVLDVRWDLPERRLRQAPEAAPEPGAGR
jgi:hypothetical protein